MVLERVSGISMDAMHIAAGVLLLLGLAALFRRPITSWLPWTGVLLAAVANEASDFMVERWPDAARQIGEGVKDLFLTMLLPTVLVLVARSRPGLIVGSGAARPDREPHERQQPPDQEPPLG